MGLTPTQKNAFEQLKEKIPEDLTSGYSVATSGAEAVASPWIKKMRQHRKSLGTNAYAYFNYTVRKGKLKATKRKPSQVISAEGFPPWVNVTYVYPPPRAFYSTKNTKRVKHFIMHSFGHGWHAQKHAKHGAIGWMNSSKSKKGVEPYDLDGKTVYVPKGTDTENMSHFVRFSAGLRACLRSEAKASAHFFIDRNGNLIVCGSCTDVLYTSNGLNGTGVGVEMEESFYVENYPKKRSKAVWRPGGKPAGTAGNVEYFAYNAKQMFTLSILVKKLETMFPPIKEGRQRIDFTRKASKKDTLSGYTIHDFIYPGSYKSGPKKGQRKHGHMDISPHFLTQALWDDFFALVDTHTHIHKGNCFKKNIPGYNESGDVDIVEPLATEELTSMTERLLDYAKNTGMAIDRAALMAQSSRSKVNSSAGRNATKNAHQKSQQEAGIQQSAQQTQQPLQDLPIVPAPTCSDGNQVGSDDMW